MVGARGAILAMSVVPAEIKRHYARNGRALMRFTRMLYK